MKKISLLFLFLSSLLFSRFTFSTSLAEPWIELQCTFRQSFPPLNRCGLNDNCIFWAKPEKACTHSCKYIFYSDFQADGIALQASSYLSKEKQFGSIRFNHRGGDLKKSSSEFLKLAHFLCEEPTDSLSDSFSSGIQKWLKSPKGVFYVEPVFREANTSSKPIRKQGKQICEYNQFEVKKDWMYVAEKTCHS